ncbi:MAG: ABC transporter ATP-binding protein [Methylococcaceae bacterium]
MKFLLVVSGIIPKDWHVRLYMLITLYMLLAIFETLGVASIMPFVALLSDPTSLNKSAIGQMLSHVIVMPVEQIPVHAVGIVVLGLFLMGNILAMTSLWVSVRFSASLGVQLTGDLANSFFDRDYSFFRSESPSILANYTVREVERAVAGAILQLCLIISKIFQVALVVVLLIVVSPTFTISFVAVALIMYALFFAVLAKKMSAAGRGILEASGKAMLTATELYTSAKEVIVRGNPGYFIGGIQAWLQEWHKADLVARIYPMFPKYLLEMTAFTMLLSLPIYRSWTGGDYRSVVPFVALFAYAGYRILPSMQQVYSSLSVLKFNAPAIEYLDNFLNNDSASKIQRVQIPVFDHEIVLKDIGFHYPGSDNDALKSISLKIYRGQKVAIVGVSGSGKTTLLDLLLGLSSPSRGMLSIDGVEYSHGGFRWGSRLAGYAPQAPLILDASVAENIAFGVAKDEIDLERCRVVADFALVGDVIAALPQGYESKLGSDGCSLSGGESQRVAIARALYHSPDILFLDEPTSSLDPILSASLLGKVCDSAFNKTVIAVTHDWDAISIFDKIILIDAGNIIGIGSFAEVSYMVDELRQRESVNKPLELLM